MGSELIGGQYIADTAVYAGRFAGIKAITATTLDTGTVSTSLRGTLTGAVIPAGATLYGYFEAVQLSGGSCVAYNIP